MRLLPSCPPVLSASQVGLTVLGRPGSAFGNEVRHIIAARDEARPHALAADQRGRWSLPKRQERRLGQHAVLPLPARGARGHWSLPARTGFASGWGIPLSHEKVPAGRWIIILGSKEVAQGPGMLIVNAKISS